MPLPLPPVDTSTAHSSAVVDLGTEFEIAGKTYIYVLRDSDDASTIAAGNVLTYVGDVKNYKVTNDISAGSVNRVAGVCVSTNLTAGTYGLILKEGRYTLNTNGDDDIANGDAIIADASADGKCNSYLVDASTNYYPTDAELQELQRMTQLPFAKAMDDDVDAANTVDAYVCVRL